jgi:nicotinate-nucleotide adenylyltransferase
MAQYVLDKKLATRVLVVPAFRSPFKMNNTVSALHRLAMARLAFANNHSIEVDDLEIKRGGASLMVDTLEEMRRRLPGASLRLIMGADNVGAFFHWKKPETILSMAEILVLGRQGHALEIPAAHQGSFLLHPEFDQRMSSTEIRVMLAAGDPVGAYLPPAVVGYIQANGLYS